MNRRNLLAMASMAVLPAVPVAAVADSGHVPYSRDAFDAAMDAGVPLLLDFYAGW